MSKAITPPSHLMLLLIGFIVWSFAFVALYAINAIGCAFLWDPVFQRAVLVVLFLAHAAFLVWFTLDTMKRYRAAKGEPDRMISYAGFGLSATALASTLFVFLPSLFVTMCI